MNENKIVLTNGPLAVVLIQIQFSPILQIAKFIPAIQDELRRKKYPLFNQIQGEDVLALPFGGVEKRKIEQWVFSSNDYSKNIIIDNQKITYQVFDCDNFKYESFVKDFITVVQSFNSVVDISSFVRLGLRYINAIPEKRDLSWKSLIKKDFHGIDFPKEVEWIGEPLIVFSIQRGVKLENLGETISNFNLNIYQHPDGTKYPQDIMRFSTEESSFYKDKPLVTFVDLDNYILFNAVDRDKVFAHLEGFFDGLHKAIGEVFFKSIITEEALEIWQ